MLNTGVTNTMTVDPFMMMKKVPNLTNYKIVKCKNFEKGNINVK